MPLNSSGNELELAVILSSILILLLRSGSVGFTIVGCATVLSFFNILPGAVAGWWLPCKWVLLFDECLLSVSVLVSVFAGGLFSLGWKLAGS